MERESNVDWLFRDLCLVEGGNSLTGNELVKTFDQDPDSSDVADPVQKLVQRASLDALCINSSVDDLDAPASPAPEKRGIPDTFIEKRSSAPGKVRLETVEVAGETWCYGYDHCGVLVSARVLEVA